MLLFFTVHTEQIRQMLNRLGNARAKLDQKKTPFLDWEYLGHLIKPRMIENASCKADATIKLKRSTNQTKLRQLPGRCIFFRWFVPEFERISTAKQETKERQSERVPRIYCRRDSCNEGASNLFNVTVSTGGCLCRRSHHIRYRRVQRSS